MLYRPISWDWRPKEIKHAKSLSTAKHHANVSIIAITGPGKRAVRPLETVAPAR